MLTIIHITGGIIIKELNLKVNGNGNSDADSHILGDVSRLMRYPNTLHMESKLFCIPLITEDLILGKNHIMQKARKQKNTKKKMKKMKQNIKIKKKKSRKILS